MRLIDRGQLLVAMGKIILASKHVLHLVSSAYVISTATETALKVARESKILGKKGQYYMEINF